MEYFVCLIIILDKETFDYLDKIFKLGMQLAAAANSTGVLGALATTAVQPTDKILMDQTDFLSIWEDRFQ